MRFYFKHNYKAVQKETEIFVSGIYDRQAREQHNFHDIQWVKSCHHYLALISVS